MGFTVLLSSKSWIVALLRVACIPYNWGGHGSSERVWAFLQSMLSFLQQVHVSHIGSAYRWQLFIHIFLLGPNHNKLCFTFFHFTLLYPDVEVCLRPRSSLFMMLRVILSRLKVRSPRRDDNCGFSADVAALLQFHRSSDTFGREWKG
jgi:hypothetical protein